MHAIDWLVLLGTILFIVLYGAWKTGRNKSIDGFLKGKDESWSTVGLSIMATQASAITFLSTPGQAYEDGMGFVQFYFGLPLAMIIISAFFLPVFYRLKVYTAYEYLENRFDLRIRLLTAFLFLVSRGLAAGITIYAPAIILSAIMGWGLEMTTIIMGLLVIIYTVSGGSRAVSLTQRWQMAVIFLGMFVAFFLILNKLPEQVNFTEAIDLAGLLGRMEVISTDFDLENRYTLWSGLAGGLMLSLSYFGTDQSQVQRYLGGRSLKASRMGLMFNGLFKVPMQFFILLVGIMVFVFYQFVTPPIYFNQSELDRAARLGFAGQIEMYEEDYTALQEEKKTVAVQWIAAEEGAGKESIGIELQNLESEAAGKRAEVRNFLESVDNTKDKRDSDYIFLTFIMDHMPIGIVGLLLAVILCAALSSTAGELNALASTTMVDYYKRLFKRSDRASNSPEENDRTDLIASRFFTVLWGLMAIGIALTASLVDNLVELVNILGSLFYGTILGIFLVALFIRRISARAVFPAVIVSQLSVLITHFLNISGRIDIGFLWYNVIGCTVLILLALAIQIFTNRPKETGH